MRQFEPISICHQESSFDICKLKEFLKSTKSNSKIENIMKISERGARKNNRFMKKRASSKEILLSIVIKILNKLSFLLFICRILLLNFHRISIHFNWSVYLSCTAFIGELSLHSNYSVSDSRLMIDSVSTHFNNSCDLMTVSLTQYK